MNVDWLIFSRDRACQLDLLLRSLERFATRRRMTVLYRASDDDYAVGYSVAVGDHHSVVYFRPETDFESNVRDWLMHPNRIAVGFLVDDDVFFAPAQAPGEGELPWTYRLPETHDWRQRRDDPEYGYPLTVDGSIYAKITLLSLLDFHFDNPTQLEAGLAAQANAFAPSTIYSAGQCLVNIPANRVSESSGNPHMDLDPAELNRFFLAGARLDLDAIVTLIREIEAERKPDPHENLPLLFE